MNQWTQPADLKAQVQKWWDQGKVMRWGLCQTFQLPQCEDKLPLQFPAKLRLKKPSAKALEMQFNQVKAWAEALRAMPYVQIKEKTLHHRLLGKNQLPNEVWLKDIQDLLHWLGKTQQYQQLIQLAKQLPTELAPVLHWIWQKPHQALSLKSEWSKLISLTLWRLKTSEQLLKQTYLRQISIAGIHTKWIEQHQTVLTAWWSQLGLKQTSSENKKTFAQQFGFKAKPDRVRFKVFDSEGQLKLLEQTLVLSDFTQQAFNNIKAVFITENEINFLAFPAVANSLIIFGSGFQVGQLKKINVLKNTPIYYWGDIDTHGFSILNQIRQHHPQIVSLLMDSKTLIHHQAYWVEEPKPTKAQLDHLTAAEQNLYQALIQQQYAPYAIRLEQERIEYDWVQQQIQNLKINR